MFDIGGVSLELNELQLEAVLRSNQGPVAKELLRLGARIEGEAKKLLSGIMVNVDTGNLRSSTTHVLVKRGRELSVFVGSSAHYSAFVHEGTIYMAERPYLKVAFRNVTGKGI